MHGITIKMILNISTTIKSNFVNLHILYHIRVSTGNYMLQSVSK